MLGIVRRISFVVIIALLAELAPTIVSTEPGVSQAARAQESEVPGDGQADEPPPALERWTKSSRTFTMPDGSKRTEMYAGQVNFKDPAGKWSEIDNRLERVPGTPGWRNAANDYEVTLPESLAEPVRAEEGRSWVTYELVGAEGTAAVEKEAIRYQDAIAGVDVELIAGNEVLKENLVLAGPESPAKFVYELDHSEDVTPRARQDGGIDFVRGDGSIPFYFAAPFMFDASGSERSHSDAVRLELNETSTQVSLRADEAWLGAAERQWPVTIDPQVVFDDPYDDVWINSSSPNTVNNGTNLRVGPSSDGTKRRILMRFGDLLNDTIPADAIVEGSSLEMDITATTTSTPLNLELLRVKRPWTVGGATWNNYASGSSWQSAGASGSNDVDSSFIDEKSMGASTGAVAFHPGRQVQKWLERDEPNEGLMIKAVDADETSKDNVITFASTATGDTSQWPTLTVDWVHRLGDRPFQTFESFAINDRQELKVNVSNGNAVIKTTDLNISSGLGSDIKVERYFNSQYNHHSHSGQNWRLGTGRDVELDTYGPDVALKYPGHYHYMFFHDGDGGWTTPPGIRGELTESSGVYEFKFRDTEEVWSFSGTGLPRTKITDRNGNELNFNYYDTAERQLHEIVNNEGQKVTFTYDDTYNPDGELVEVEDWTGRSVSYTYCGLSGSSCLANEPGTGRRLASFTDADGKTVNYTYNSIADITCIATSERRVIKLTYDSHSSPRVASVSRVSSPPSSGDPCDGTGNKTWSFSYGSRSGTSHNATTTVTDARTTSNFEWKYTHDTEGRVVKTVDPLGNISESEWTSQSSVSKYTDAAGSASSSGTDLYEFSYNTGGDVEGVRFPSGAESKMTYSSSPSQQHLPKDYTDEQGNEWHYEYYGPSETGGNENQLKFVCVVPDPNASSKDCSSSSPGSSATWDYTYFGNGNLDTIDDAKGADTRHTYFSDGNLQKVDHPTPLPDRSFTYDALNRQATMTDGKSQTTTYFYDPIDRVDKIEYDDGSTVDYTYDGDGNIISRKEGSSETLYTFNALGQLTNKEDRSGTTTVAETSFSYDNVGNLRFLTHDPGTSIENEIEYTYDGANDPDKVYLPNRTNPVDITYTSRRHEMTEFPNGVTMTYKPHADGNIEVLKAGITGNLTKWENIVYDREDGSTNRRNIQQIRLRDASVTCSRGSTTTTTGWDACGRRPVISRARTTSSISTTRTAT